MWVNDYTKLCLDGLPALQRCRLRFHKEGNCKQAYVSLSPASFHSLQHIMLRGVSSGVHAKGLSWCIVGVPALRQLEVQNMGLTDLGWLEAGWTSSGPVAPLQSLDLDDNEALQLSGVARSTLFTMTALQKLSMRKRSAQGDASTAGGAAGSCDAAPQEAAWPDASLRCFAQLAAARPDLQLLH